MEDRGQTDLVATPTRAGLRAAAGLGTPRSTYGRTRPIALPRPLTWSVNIIYSPLIPRNFFGRAEESRTSKRSESLTAFTLVPNSHSPPDTTRRSCLCRVGRSELSLETVRQSLNSQPIDHRRRVAFSEEV